MAEGYSTISQNSGEDEHLLSRGDGQSKERERRGSAPETITNETFQLEMETDDGDEGSQLRSSTTGLSAQPMLGVDGSQVQYKVYKRRWFGLMQLVLLNIVLSWDVS